jgi:hypothetical protein
MISWIKRKLFKIETLRVNAYTKGKSNKIPTGKYVYEYGRMTNGSYGYSNRYQPYGGETIKLPKAVDLQCLDANGNQKSIQIEHWPKFSNYVKDELKQGKQPIIKVRYFFGFPFVIYYANNNWYACNICSFTLLCILNLCAIGLLIGVFL